MKIRTQDYMAIAREQLKEPNARAVLDFFPVVLSLMRDAAYQSFADPAAAMQCSGAIRANAVARLPKLLEQFEAQAIKAGAKVVWAEDSQQANAYITDLAKKRGVQYVAKGKSMVTEEVGLNEALEKEGISAYETDLGEFITQLLKRPPFHIVGPALNVPVAEIRDIFLEKGVMTEPTDDPVELGLAARKYLRDKFHHLDMGVTGINMAVAETGTIINVENEGNIRMCKSSPKIQVSIMTLEKVVPTMAEAMMVMRNLTRSATGQMASAYASMDTGPKKAEEADGPEELHIIILDNGRSKVYTDPTYRQALQCIRCGACLNFCPIYRKVGGYSYGWAYSGPMGQVLSPMLLGLDKTRDLYHSCTLCKQCKTICPGGVEHPKILLTHRARNREQNVPFHGAGVSPVIEARYRGFAAAALRPAVWNTMVRVVRTTLNQSKQGSMIKELFGKPQGWFATRDLPPIGRPTFGQWYKEYKKHK
ncbi:MAG: lactate utilization protein [Desulfatibacillum sp.]|nr:lactate utilization protein [Desulfatibacillum sp.]